MSELDVRVLKITRLPGNHPLMAFVDVQVGSWTIFDWRLLQKPGERIQVTYPNVSYRDTNGVVRYRALLSIPGELKQRIEVAILSAWEKEIKHGLSGNYHQQ